MVKSKFSAKLLKAMDNAESKHVQAKVTFVSANFLSQDAFGIAMLAGVNPLVIEGKIKTEPTFVLKVKNSVSALEDLSNYKCVTHLS